jgi:hypothetical protein
MRSNRYCIENAIIPEPTTEFKPVTTCQCYDDDIGHHIAPSCPVHGHFGGYIAKPGTMFKSYREVGAPAKGRKGV